MSARARKDKRGAGKGRSVSSSTVFLCLVLGLRCPHDIFSLGFFRPSVPLQPSNQTAPTKGPSIITTCMGPLFGDSINVVGIVGWLKYYEERWGLTHAEVYIRKENFEKTRADLLQTIRERAPSVEVELNFHSVPNNIDPSTSHTLCQQESVSAANQRNSSYFLNFHADEFLVSEKFQTWEEMFAAFNNKPGIAFPIFHVNYAYCEANRPTFDSTTYHYTVPVGYKMLPNDDKIWHPEPPHGVGDNREYIVRPQETPNVQHVPLQEEDKFMTFMTGRSWQNQDVKVMRYGTERGLHVDVSTNVCEHVPAKINDTVRKDNLRDARMIHGPTEVNRILTGYPFSAQAERFYNEAVCYAERHPQLKKRFCTNGDTNHCNAKLLREQYDRHRNEETIVYGCKSTY